MFGFELQDPQKISVEKFQSSMDDLEARQREVAETTAGEKTVYLE